MTTSGMLIIPDAAISCGQLMLKAGLKAKFEELEGRKAALEVDSARTPLPVPRLHPNLVELYRRKVEDLHAALADPGVRTEAADILRGLIEAINGRPIEGGVEIEMVGDLAQMVKVAETSASTSKKAAPGGAAVQASFTSSAKVVVGTRNHRQLTLPPISV